MEDRSKPILKSFSTTSTPGFLEDIRIEGVSILWVEIVHKIIFQERGDRGIEFRNRNDPQLSGIH